VVDPLLAPIERRIVRAGGTPASAPWWGLVAVVVGGIVLISVVNYVVGIVLGLALATRSGGAALPAALLSLAIGVLQIALLVRVFSSWLPVSPMSPWIRWSYGLTEWILAPLRQIVPTIGAFDITPIVAYYLIQFLGGFLVEAIARVGT
jgi:YggT family protein